MEFITFLLAPIGYACLTLIMVLSVHGRVSPVFSSTTVAIIVVHVLMVWRVPYGWKFSEATRDGFAVRHYRWPVLAIAVAGVMGIAYKPAAALINRFSN